MGAFELSFAQERMWLLDRLLPPGPIYNLARVARLNGALDIDALRRALNDVMQRHQVLRSRFAVENGMPLQLIAAELKVALEVEDLGALPPEERKQDAQRRARDEAQVPFDLQHGPLVRARLLRLAENEHWLLLTFHHIVADDWSMAVLWRELSMLYDVRRQDSTSLPVALPLQYIDYSVWQRGWLQTEVLERQLAYWEQALAGVPALTLPTDRSRPVQPSYRGRQLALVLDEELTGSLRALGHREGTTFFTTLLAALQVLLYRYTGQEDIAVGVPVAGRRRPDDEGLIGFFVNTLVLRGDLSGEPTFKDYLGRVRLRAQQAYAHQDVPFEMLVEKLHPKRDSTRNPLFQVMLNKWTPEGQVLRLAGLEPADVVATHTGTAKFDLQFVVVEKQGHCHVTMEYATDLFDAATIQRLAGHFTTLLEAIVADPEQCIGQLPLLSAAERHQVLVEWNDTAADYPREKCVHQLFEEQVERMPEAVAVVFEDRQLTYGELNAHANQLAHHLITLGVRPEVLVGLCLERSLEMVIGLLGILKAGGAYVPLDPRWPPDRARLVVEDAGLAAVVTQRDYVDRLPPLVPMVFVDARSESGEARAENNPDLPVSPADPVYVLYTSGTTGLPKGVLIEHQQLVQYVWAVADQLDLDARGKYAMLQPLTVDSCQTMIFPSLGRGGTLHLISEERALDAMRLTDYYGHHQIDYLKIAPSHLAALLDQLPSVALLPGRALIIGGEASHWDFIDRLWSLAPRCAVWNHYGPTETTVGVSVCRLDPADSRVAMTVPIGRPLANVRYYVLDQNLQPVPFGVPGELFIGGEQVARGYLDRAELTADRFVPDPFSEKPNARLYRSGDQVRYLADGKIEFLGRKDQQVKIRGFRIEMGEIEAVLRDAEGVREAVVSVANAIAGGKRLVAFVVPDGNALLDDRGLKASLATRLPDYMVPSQFILLPNLPRTPHGKVDRKALEEMDAAELAVETAYVAPRTVLEEVLTEVWREVLKLEQIGVHNNFFELGGHSLLAVQVVSRIRRQLGLSIPLRAIFEHPTIETLAMFLLEKQVEAESVGDMERMLVELEALTEEAAADQHRTTIDVSRSVFHCQDSKSAWFGRRRCNLLILLNEDFERDSFERVARWVREFDPLINAVVLRDQAGTKPDLPAYPALTFSPAVVRHPLAARGYTFCGYPLSKSQEYAAMEKGGICVPKWVLLSEGAAPDLTGFDRYVVQKPDYGGKGAEVRVVRKGRVRWKPITTQALGTSSSLIIQELIHTGPQPVSYRVNTLFGKVLYSARYEGSSKAAKRETVNEETPTQEWGSIVASARGARVSLNFDEEIIRLGEAAAGAFPETPLLGVDIIREEPSGKLYVLEANAIGYVWNFHSCQVANYGFSFEEQFDGVRKAAYILAEKTQQHAC